MKKTFWFINQYSSTPEVGLGGRHYYLAEELALQGHKVYVIASSYNHLHRYNTNQRESFRIESIRENFDFIWIKVPKYKAAHSKVRALNWLIFSAKIFNLKNLKIDKPNVIIYSSPSPFGYFSSKFLANYFKVPFVFEVRDIWPLTLVELGGISESHPLIRLMQWTEDKAYKNSDFVFSNLCNAKEHMVSRGMNASKFQWIPNGFSLNEIDNKEELKSSIVTMIPKDKFIVGYTGTIGTANALYDLIEAARVLSPYPEIHFLLVGDGKDKKKLVELSRKYDLQNITFLDSIPKRQVQSIIEFFNVCFIGSQKKSIYRFGVAPNKIPEYLYSGKPIIHAFSGEGCLIKQSGAGLSIESGNPLEIANAILDLYNTSADTLNNMGKRGKAFALENLNYENISKKLISTLFDDQ